MNGHKTVTANFSLTPKVLTKTPTPTPVSFDVRVIGVHGATRMPFDGVPTDRDRLGGVKS